MVIYTIYMVSNHTTKKVYIGWTSRVLELRKKEHIRESYNKNCPSSKQKFHKAINKYGVDQFNWNIIYQSKNRDHSLEMEKYFINLYNSNHRDVGYNLTTGGEGFCGPRSDETKKKLSDAAKQRPTISEETRKKLSDINKKRWEDPIYRQKMSDCKKGEKNIMFGKTHTKEVKERLRQLALIQHNK